MPRTATKQMEPWMRLLVLSLESVGITGAVPEFRFHDERKWRIDLAYPQKRVGLEREGGIWTGGRHTRGKGFEKDIEKYAEAACLGWTIIRATPRQIENGQAYDWLVRVMGREDR